MLAALISVLTTTASSIALLSETIDFFGEVGIGEFLFGTEWTPLFEPASFGVLPLVAGTLADHRPSPCSWRSRSGSAAAIYLSEYARPRVRKTVKPVLELLAGVPTIVFGYFALTFFTPEILRSFLGIDVSDLQRPGRRDHHGLHDHPDRRVGLRGRDVGGAAALREGAFGLGASKLQVSLRVVFPAALSGIVAAIVLGDLARDRRDDDRADRRRAGSRNGARPARVDRDDDRLHRRHREGRHPPPGASQYKTIFAVGMMLFVITLIMNMISIRFVRKYRQVYE